MSRGFYYAWKKYSEGKELSAIENERVKPISCNCFGPFLFIIYIPIAYIMISSIHYIIMRAANDKDLILSICYLVFGTYFIKSMGFRLT